MNSRLIKRTLYTFLMAALLVVLVPTVSAYLDPMDGPGFPEPPDPSDGPPTPPAPPPPPVPPPPNGGGSGGGTGGDGSDGGNGGNGGGGSGGGTAGSGPIGVPDTPLTQVVCADSGAASLSAGEVNQLLMTAAAAVGGQLTVAVVDRAGRPLGLYRRAVGNERDDRAVGLARTGAFFSNNQAPLSSRTVRHVSGIHFPPGIPNTPNAALYGIENTNRGCSLNAQFNNGRTLPQAKSVVRAGRCDAFDQSACGTGPVTGKADLFDSRPGAIDPGGVPIFRGAALVGGIGVVASGGQGAEFAAFAAAAGVGNGLFPVPQPLPAPGVVFIDGIRLPFVRFVDRPAGFAPGDASAGSVVIGPFNGGCAPDGYLVGPMAGQNLSRGDVERLVEQSRQAALRTRAVIRLPLGSRARMVIAVSDVNGQLLALFRMRDATIFSVDVAAAKARNVVWFGGAGSRDLPGVPAGTAVTNRTISFGSQPLFPAGIDGSGPGPFFDLFQQDTFNLCSQGSQPTQANQNGVVFFPGSMPLYSGGALVGGLGISGDGVEQDDYVSFLGAAGFLPAEAQWADRVFIQGVRMPFLKFPRNPER